MGDTKKIGTWDIIISLIRHATLPFLNIDMRHDTPPPPNKGAPNLPVYLILNDTYIISLKLCSFIFQYDENFTGSYLSFGKSPKPTVWEKVKNFVAGKKTDKKTVKKADKKTDKKTDKKQKHKAKRATTTPAQSKPKQLTKEVRFNPLF